MEETKTEFALNLTLNRDRYEQLLLAIGMAVGAALKHNDVDLALRFFDLVNYVSKDNPNFVPYVFFTKNEGDGT